MSNSKGLGKRLKERIIAIHEAGHATTMEYLGQRVLKVTIDKSESEGARGLTLGDDLFYESILIGKCLMAGIAAEQLHALQDKDWHDKMSRTEREITGRHFLEDFNYMKACGEFEEIRTCANAFNLMMSTVHPDNVQKFGQDMRSFTDEAIQNDDATGKKYAGLAVNGCFFFNINLLMQPEFRKAVNTLASELLRKRTMTGEQTRDILGKYFEISPSTGRASREG